MPRLSPEALEYLERRVDADRAYTLELLRVILPEPPRPPDVASLLSAIASVAVEYLARSRVSGDVVGAAADAGETAEEEYASEPPVNFTVLVGGMPIMQISVGCPTATRTEYVRDVLRQHPEWRGLPVEAAPVYADGRVGPPRAISPASTSILGGYLVAGGRVRRYVQLANSDEVAPLAAEYDPDAEIVLGVPPLRRVSLTEAAEMLAAPPWWPEAPAEPAGAAAVGEVGTPR